MLSQRFPMKALVVAQPLYKSSSFFSTPNPKNFPTFSPIFSRSKHPNLYNPMATCIDTSRTDTSRADPLSLDPNKPRSDDNHLNFGNFCRNNFRDQVSCSSICQNRTLTTQTRWVVDCVEEEDEDKGVDLWTKVMEEARSDIEEEPILSNYYFSSILAHNSIESALANHLSVKLSDSSLPSGTLIDIFMGVLGEDEEIVRAVKDDLRAAKERDPACISYVHCLLNFKGFLACQAHRVSHKLWSQGRKVLALLIQNRVSEVFSVDIHPGAKIGHGILLDHATGVVVGETAVIGNNVSILHNVTLGGTGKISGDRHPKIGDGVLIGAGTCILGNIKIGEGAKIGERPPLSFRILRWAFLLGALQTILSQLMLTMSLQYIDSTFQSVALNLVPAIVFVLALIFHQEKLKFWSINGQVKILSIVISVGGALVLVLWKGPILLTSVNPSNYFGESQDKAFIGSIMVIVAVLASSFGNIVLGHVIKFYPAEMSLAAMMNFFGTIQTTIFSAFVLSSTAWKPKWDGGLTLLTILMGGFGVTGFFYYVSTWVIKKKGVVFATAFSPLLVLFSFILQTLFLGSPTHLGRYFQ